MMHLWQIILVAGIFNLLWAIWQSRCLHWHTGENLHASAPAVSYTEPTNATVVAAFLWPQIWHELILSRRLIYAQLATTDAILISIAWA